VEGGVLDLGLRYDRISPGGEHPNVPAFISSSGPAYWNPNAATDDTAYANSVSRTFQTTRTQSAFSPRISLTYPVTPKAEIRLAYSRSLEPLAWGTFFARSNSDLAFTDVRDLFGRDIDFASVGLAEGGVRFTLGHTLLDVGVYRKNSPTYVGRITPFEDPKDPTRLVGINVVTVLDVSHTQGVDLGVQWQRGWLDLSGAYSLAHTTGAEGSLTAPNLAPVTLHTAALGGALEVPHDVQGGVLASVARDLSVALLARVQSGEPYTLLQNTGSGVIAPGPRFGSLPVEPFNASSLPWLKRLDLRITKTLRIGGHDWSAYADVRNLLDLSNLTSLFAETGSTTNARHQLTNIIGDPTIGTGEYGNLWNEATDAGALQPDGTTVDLSTCAPWASQANCVSLLRVEQRFGNGDRSFTLAEQETAFNAYYRDFFGEWRFYAPGRTARFGIAFEL
jgi:TonB-dependent receptor-like protein